ncbi:CDP-alcohol phosphatidyltransferase family protein [Pedobacter psychrodurus]|uniref:CDP-alcohol phosphatidyltransferase family protein n=1 Tax=Pedobacter psychrodurus TaxID=2530456 RepID=A0A4R0PG67_9SPHI|nr:CDP-alcohol phosphatidyltransferase family protein [Pedobacter psychrodurus]TCD17212.1 CDP-alcohol phosphatidyltransferase family protein [Pedobacter psychrodurus]
MEDIIKGEEGNTDSKRVFSDRERTNILRKGEQRLILFLLKKVPGLITPNMMTGIGMFGSLIVFLAFILGSFYSRNYLLMGILGFIINWLGDSLDGRLAYYRKIARKWYGFALDIVMDWLSIILIGLGYYFYAPGTTQIFAFLFVVLYGWSMIISQLRYKITGFYQIDSGHLGPTELRVMISLILIIETLIVGSIIYFAIAVTILLSVINIIDTLKLLKAGDAKDREEKE